jgi:hypothetical protein
VDNSLEAAQDQLASRQKEDGEWFGSLTVRRILLWVIMPVCWFLQAASYRHTPLTDAICYLDMAQACIRGNLGALVNGYWSPLFPSFLAVWLGVLRPSPSREVEVAQYLSCVLLIIAGFSFEYFLRCLRAYTDATSNGGPTEQRIPFAAIGAIGYSLFFWASLYMLPPSLITPDVLVWISILVAGATLLRIKSGVDGWLNFATLGFSLGLGYLAKAFMFPASFIVFGVLVFYFDNWRRYTPRLLLSLLVFLLAASPAVVSLSKAKGRFTFGDTGAINYAEYVNGVVYSYHWQGGPPGSGTPKHPTRKILDSPIVYEYASPIPGTYPLGYDLSYWYEGVRPHFELRGQLDVLRHSFDFYFDLFTRLSCLAAGFFALFLSERHFKPFFRDFLALGFLWIPSLAAFALYSLVHVEIRFFPGFLLMICMSFLVALRIPQSAINAVRCICVGMVMALGIQTAWAAGHNIVRLVSPNPFPEGKVVKALEAVGIKPGDHVAFIGWVAPETYWAHLAGVSFVAEVPAEGTTSFMLASQETRAHVIDLFKQAGADAVLTKSLSQEVLSGGWKKLGNTEYFILLLDKN